MFFKEHVQTGGIRPQSRNLNFSGLINWDHGCQRLAKDLVELRAQTFLIYLLIIQFCITTPGNKSILCRSLATRLNLQKILNFSEPVSSSAFHRVLRRVNTCGHSINGRHFFLLLLFYFYATLISLGWGGVQWRQPYLSLFFSSWPLLMPQPIILLLSFSIQLSFVLNPHSRVFF